VAAQAPRDELPLVFADAGERQDARLAPAARLRGVRLSWAAERMVLAQESRPRAAAAEEPVSWS
jgi:hypothetical protein